MTDFEGFFLLRKFFSACEKVVFEEISSRGVDPVKEFFQKVSRTSTKSPRTFGKNHLSPIFPFFKKTEISEKSRKKKQEKSQKKKQEENIQKKLQKK